MRHATTKKTMTRKTTNTILAVLLLVAIAIAGTLMFLGVQADNASANAAEAQQEQAQEQEAQAAKKGELVPDGNMLPTEEYKAKKDMLDDEMDAAHEKEEQETAQAHAAAQTQAASGEDANVPQEHATTLDTTKKHYATVAGASGHTDLSEQTNGSISSKTPDQAPDTINILGETIPFVDSYLAKRAPEHGCGIWKGDDPVDDGQMCYFVGHNPGDFHNVMNLREGNKVTVCDDAGHIKTYTVHDTFTVPQVTTYGKIADRVEGHGESIVMQTCCGDNMNVRVVVAW